MKCQIQWIDAQGKATADDHAAVGFATCTFYDALGNVRDANSFPI